MAHSDFLKGIKKLISVIIVDKNGEKLDLPVLRNENLFSKLSPFAVKERNE